MPSTLRFPALMELPNFYPDLFLVPKKVTRTLEHEFFACVAIAGEWLFIGSPARKWFRRIPNHLRPTAMFPIHDDE